MSVITFVSLYYVTCSHYSFRNSHNHSTANYCMCERNLMIQKKPQPIDNFRKMYNAKSKYCQTGVFIMPFLN